MSDAIDLSVHKLIYAPHDALTTKVADFPADNTEYRNTIAKHMKSIMETHRGVGLAANQINLDAAVQVQMIQRDIVAMFNPQIHEVSQDKVLMSEGCLSVPGLYLKIKRPDVIRASWEDAAGDRITETLHGMDCRVFLHEYDHLQGIMFTDRIGKLKLEMARKKQSGLLSRAAERIMARIQGTI